MSSVNFQPRPLYEIGTVSRLTGIKPDTLRVWEKRYQLGASQKSPTGRRRYTQAELEHLQLIAELVAQGVRIGEIAHAKRRTLEVMLMARNREGVQTLPEGKPCVAFIGESIARWLDAHQGCIAGVDALVMSHSLAEYVKALPASPQSIDILVVEAGSSADLEDHLETVVNHLSVGKVLVCLSSGMSSFQSRLEQSGFHVCAFPPPPAFLSSHLRLWADEEQTQAGATDIGELVQSRPRMLCALDLAAADDMTVSPISGCQPANLGEIVRNLAELEEMAAASEVDGWEEASLQACVYAYTGQARWLMEKALGLVLESKRDV